MKERNRQTLRDALDRLPRFDPPPGLWSDVRRELEPRLADRLPSYQPPAQVWNELSGQLSEQTLAGTQVPQPEEKSKPGRLRPLRWLAVAATFLLLVLAGQTLLNRDAGPKVSFAYDREVAPAAVTPDWTDDEQSFVTVLAELEARNEPELNTLRMELDELTEASNDVKAMLTAYGEDPQVVRQLAEIERDRSDVYRRIIVRL